LANINKADTIIANKRLKGRNIMNKNRNILCIDLKSFFASVECVERGLNAFTTPLVVANPNQGKGAITLAVTPFLKKQGINGRTRLYNIPKNIPYQIVPPRMNLYIKRSKEIIQIYLDFISQEDLHIYSIDECFLDVTSYLQLYQLTDIELAQKILKTIEQKTGLTATCGIGPNMLLAKLAMDLEAKKYKNGIAKWNLEDIPTKLWPITPLSKMWGIGSRLEKKLNLIGIYTIGDLAHANPKILQKKFGILGEELWNHANGIDEAIISKFQKETREKSISHSQVLLRDYYNDEILLIIREMLDVLTTRMRAKKLETSCLSFGLSYSKTIGGGFHHSIKLNHATDLSNELYPLCQTMFEQFYEENMPIRKISLSFSKLSPKLGLQLNLFEEAQESQKKEKISTTMDHIKEKYGKNSILKASSLLPNSTIHKRNETIGGHHE